MDAIHATEDLFQMFLITLMGFHDNIIDIDFTWSVDLMLSPFNEARLEISSEILVQIEPQYTRLLC